MRKMNKHIFTPFDTELEAVQKRVLLMGEQVARQVTHALDGLANNNMDLIETVIQTDKQINQEEVALDEICVQLIARHSPAASDLRLIMTIMQMVTDLERIGDEAKKIAKAARPIIEAESAFVPKIELRHGANLALGMLNQALDAFARMDPSSTADIIRQDKEVDAIFKGILRQLATYMMEDPRLITRSLDVLFIAKSIERVGDHATNIAEHVVYIVKGRDIRHEKLDSPEQ